MALTFVGSKSAGFSSTSNQSVSLTDLKDSSNNNATLQAGDIVIVSITHSMATTANRSFAQLNPAGYVGVTGLSSSIQANDNNAVSLAAFYKIMPATPDTTITIPGCAASTNSIAYTIEAWRGQDVIPFSLNGVQTASGSNTGLANPPSITTDSSPTGQVVLGFFGAAVASAAVFANGGATPYDSTTNLFSSGVQNTATNRAVSGMGAKTGLAVSTAFDAAITGSNTTNTGSWAAMAAKLMPAVLKTLTWYRNGSNNLNYGYVSESAPAGAVVGTVGGNAEKQAASTLAIAGSGNTGGGRFAIDSSTGVVTVVSGATFNYGSEPTILLDIVETLSGASGSPKTTTLTIRVKPLFGSTTTVAWDTNDRLGTSFPGTVTGTSVTGTDGVGAYQSIRADRGYDAGASAKIYVEATVNSMGSGGQVLFGFGSASADVKSFNQYVPGFSDTTGFSWKSDGVVAINGAYLNGGSPITGASYTAGDRLNLCIDIATGKVWIGKNGTWVSSGDPSAGTSPIGTVTSPEDYFLWVGPQNNQQITVNWGDSSFTDTIPTGAASYKTGIASGNAGAATGAGSASGVGASIARADGASAGIGSATGVGRAQTLGAGAAAGVGAAAAVPIVSGNAVGSGSAAATGSPLAAGAGASAGSGTASGVGRAQTNAAGASSGVGAASGVGLSTALGAGSSSAVGAAAAVGASLGRGAGSATGTGSAAATAVTGASAGSASGSGSAAATGASVALTSGSAAGAGSGSATGAAQTSAVGEAAGAGTASAAGTSLARAAAASAGAGTATGVGAATATTAGASSGAGAASAAGTGVVAAAGSSSGTSTAVGSASAYSSGVGLSAGFGVAVGDGRSIALASGFATGLSVANAVGEVAVLHPIVDTPGARRLVGRGYNRTAGGPTTPRLATGSSANRDAAGELQERRAVGSLQRRRSVA
jgi:hypothetical protein